MAKLIMISTKTFSNNSVSGAIISVNQGRYKPKAPSLKDGWVLFDKMKGLLV